MSDRVRVIKVETLADDWAVLRKAHLEVQLRDGSWAAMTRETYDRGDGAVILPYDAERGRVLLGRQFRWPAEFVGHHEDLIEAAAGLLDDANPEDRIRAETSEELGLELGPARQIMTLFMSPGSVTERLHFFVAAFDSVAPRGAGGGLREEGEDIAVLDLSIGEAMEMVADGRICDAKTVVLLQYAALHLFKDRLA